MLTLQGSAFPGLLNLVYMYLETLDVEDESRRRIEEYLDLVRRRTDGTWMCISSSLGPLLIDTPSCFSSAVSAASFAFLPQAGSGPQRAGFGSSFGGTRRTSSTRWCRRRLTMTSCSLSMKCQCLLLLHRTPEADRTGCVCRERGLREAPDFLPPKCSQKA